jgi:hypothetical protein
MPTIFSAKIPAQVASEGGTFPITINFLDEDGVAVVPNAASWSLTREDRVTIVNGREEEVITPASEVIIVLQGDDLASLNEKPLEWRYLVIEGTYNSTLGTDLPLKDHLKFPVVNIAKVPLEAGS